MSDTRVPAEGKVPSHTSTEQWQSFEVRMRRRRVERCLVRAQVALEAGFEDDAQAALAEARQLDSSAPDLPALQARMAAAAPAIPPAAAPPLADAPAVTPPPAEPVAQTPVAGRQSRWMMPAAAAALIFIGALGGTFWKPATARNVRAQSAPAAETPRGDVHLPATPPATPQRPPVSVKEELVPVTESLFTSPAVTLTRNDTPAGAPADAPARAASDVVRPFVPPAAPAEEPRSLPSVPADRPIEASIAPLNMPVPSAPLPSPPPVPVASAPEPAPPSSTAGTAGTSGAPAPRIDETARVRAVLARYQAAYSGLDAAAARAVYPAVDQRALARAFSGLQSQRLSLDHCDVSVVGLAAKAECAGSTTWTPKVGGGGRTEAKRWSFDLRNAAGNWQIVRTEAR